MIFDDTELTEDDRIDYTYEYSGGPAHADRLIVSTDRDSSAMISSITEGTNPVGSFIITQYELGTKIKTIHNDLTVLGDVALVNLQYKKVFSPSFIRMILDIVRPQSVTILDSAHQSELAGDIDAPSLFIIDSEHHLPCPNYIAFLSAGFFTEGPNPTVLYLVEENTGSSIESMRLWADQLAHIIPFDPAEISKLADYNASLKSMDYMEIFS